MYNKEYISDNDTRAVNAINVEGGQNIEIENYLTIPLPGSCAATKPVAGGEMALEIGQLAYENNPANVEAENVDLNTSQVDNCKLTSTKNSEDLEINCTKKERNYRSISSFAITSIYQNYQSTLTSPPAETSFKYHQVRYVRRSPTKIDIKTQKANKWRIINLAKHNKESRLVGNFVVQSGQVIRKMRSEAKCENSRHTDSSIELYLMSQDKNWSVYIKKYLSPWKFIYILLSNKNLLNN
uniref:Uncharacterized protein n=1 Tax=Glossina palpalis gambiensis TaxID=67801 RepID=A0A1B0B9T1_9MUSC